MEQTILSNDQLLVLDFIRRKSEVNRYFYLTGGTALAEFYLQHRYSDDIDFFTNEKDFPQLVVESAAKEIGSIIGAREIEYKKLYDRRIFFFKKDGDELKMEFTQYPFLHLQQPQNNNQLLVDSFEDIAANKLMALIDRIEPKDFVDLFFILQKTNLENILNLVKRKFDFKIDPLVLGSEFAKIKGVTIMPKMIKPLSLEKLKTFYSDSAKQLKPQIVE